MTLDELRQKYNFSGGNYEPKPDCKFCHGTGEKKTLTGHTFCICLFVMHNQSDHVGETLSNIAKNLRVRMQ